MQGVDGGRSKGGFDETILLGINNNVLCLITLSIICYILLGTYHMAVIIGSSSN